MLGYLREILSEGASKDRLVLRGAREQRRQAKETLRPLSFGAPYRRNFCYFRSLSSATALQISGKPRR